MLFALSLLFSNQIAALTVYSQSNGTWGPGGTLALFNTAPDGSGTDYDGNTTAWENLTTNVIIQDGHQVIFQFSSFLLENITVGNNAKLYSNDISSSSNYKLLLYGNNHVIKGEIGNGVPANPAQADRMAMDINGGLYPSCTISGGGKITVRELNWDLSIELTIEAEVNIHRYVTSWQTWFLYTQLGAGIARDFTIGASGALNVYGNFAHDFDLRSSHLTASNISDYQGRLVVEGAFRVYEGNLMLKTDNTGGQNFNLIVNGAGQAYFEHFIFCNGGAGDPSPYNGLGSVSLEISGLLETNAANPVQYSSSNSYVQMQTGSTFKLSGGGGQLLDNDVLNNTFYNVELAGTGPKELAGTVDIENNLIFTTSGVDLGNSDLNMTKTFPNSSFTASSVNDVFQNSSSTKFINTNGTGAVTAYVPRGSFFYGGIITWPIGNGTYCELYFSSHPSTAATGDFYTLRVLNQVLSGGTTGSPITSLVVQKTWDISEQNAGGETLNATFMWDSSEESVDFNNSITWISHYDGTSWDVDNQGTGASGTSGSYNIRSRNGINTFSPYAVFSSLAALPVELLNFEGEITKKGNVLEWQTASETDNKQFNIEHSTDLRNFTTIGTVAGMGNSNSLQSYDFTHYNPIKGVNYYRLAQIDFSGAMEYSEMIALERTDNANSMKVFPTAVTDQLFFTAGEWIANGTQLEVLNQLGHQVFQAILTSETLQNSIDVSRLVPGKYWVRLKTAHQAFDAVPFIKY